MSGKMDAVMDLYKTVYPHAVMVKNGTWIRIDYKDGSELRSCHSTDLLEEIFSITGKSYEWDSEFKKLFIEYDKNDSWTTGNNWNTKEPPMSKDEFYTVTEIEDSLFDDIGEV